MRRGIVLPLLVALAACGDQGPDGPGSLVGSVRTSGAPLGAVVMDVSGSGVEKVTGSGSTRVFTVGSLSTTTLRVIAVVPSPGSIDFTVHVSDLQAGTPNIVVVDAAGSDNQPITHLASIRATLSRR